MSKECELCKDHDCINCDVPTSEPEDCQYCLDEEIESGIEYERNFTYKDDVWICDNCGQLC